MACPLQLLFWGFIDYLPNPVFFTYLWYYAIGFFIGGNMRELCLCFFILLEEELFKEKASPVLLNSG